MKKLLNFFIAMMVFTTVGLGSANPVFAAGTACGQTHLVLDLSHLQKSDLIAAIGKSVDSEVSQSVTNDLKKILNQNLDSKNSNEMNQIQFNALLVGITKYANQNGIRIHSGIDTIGVFPEGLSQIKVSGLSKIEKNGQVGFAKRHELAHLFHVVQVRAILLKTITESPLTKDLAEVYLQAFEGGANYRQFEKAVTSISGSLHVFNVKSRSQAEYVAKVSRMLDGVRSAIQSGMVRLKTGKTIFDIYALVLSKAPLVVGKSMGDLALRLPFILFAATYFSNSAFHENVNNFIKSAL